MDRTNINRGWQFARNGLSPNLEAMLAGAQTVHLPHDFTIGTDPCADAKGGHAAGWYDGGLGSYTKTIDVPADWDGRRVLLEIDGAYRNAEVVLNGHTVTKQLGGYFPFHADLTPYVIFGEQNRLTVAVNTTAPYDSRWYTGSGLYRHVDLLTAPPVHLAPWSVFFHTLRVDPDGTAYGMAEVTVENHTAKPVTEYVNVTLSKEGCPKATGRFPVAVPPLGKATARIPLVIENPSLWDIDHPNLYAAKAELDSGDADQTAVGIRTVTVDVKHGLRLNGQTVKLKGGCVHHDNGLLGAVSLYDAEYRKLKLLKDHGYNAVRCAHNPPSRDMLDACDRLGLLVIDEAFDCWQMRDGYVASDYHLIFADHWKRDMEKMITRDRGHPCIIMWSIGNEIVERNGLSGGYALAAEIAAYARTLDPTRPLTCAIPSPFNGLGDADMALVIEEWAKKGNEIQYSLWGPRTEPFAAPLDVVWYNYLDERYEQDGLEYPNRVICGEESYPGQIDIVWDKVERLPYVIGDFVWTAIDYIGEAGIGRADYRTEEEDAPVNYPWRLAYCGDFDLCGFPRPQLFYRKIVWGSDETYIAVRPPANEGRKEILSRWAWPECYAAWNFEGYEGKPVRVDVYSRAGEAELFLNGRSIGVKPAGKANRYTATFCFPYQPGTLLAVSRAGGREISRATLATAGNAAAIRLTSDRVSLPADGHALAYVTAELIDGQGRVVPFEDKLLRASVTGDAALAAFGAGRPVTAENYTKGAFTSWLGRCVSIVRSGVARGQAVLRVEAEGLEAAEVTIQIQ